MTPAERDLITKLDGLILNASKSELKKIQEIDLKTQLDGCSFYDSYVNYAGVHTQKIKQKYNS